MMVRTVLGTSLLLCSVSSWSFTCYITVAKDNCWANYNVNVEVIDSLSSNVLKKLEIPKGKTWDRQSFECDAMQKLMYQARFTPVFWKGEENKVYSAERFWFMPEKINPGDKAWTIDVCYPKDFGQVPMPPEAGGDCKCDFSSIPPLKLD